MGRKEYNECVSMMPRDSGTASADYDIAGYFSSLTFSVGLNDDVEFSLSDVVFKVDSVYL